MGGHLSGLSRCSSGLLCPLDVQTDAMSALRSALRLPFGLCLLGVLICPGILNAQTEDICSEAIQTAEEQYREGAYQEARQVVSACLNQDEIPTDQAVEAYRLLTLIHLKQDQLEAAREAVVNLLGVDPKYEPDEVESPPSYVSLVSVVKEELDTEQLEDDVEEDPPFFQRRSTWLTIGGVVLGSGVAYFTLGGGGDGGGPSGSDTLPIPPSPPGSGNQ